jgi:hypothetical protein
MYRRVDRCRRKVKNPHYWIASRSSAPCTRQRRGGLEIGAALVRRFRLKLALLDPQAIGGVAFVSTLTFSIVLVILAQ